MKFNEIIKMIASEDDKSVKLGIQTLCESWNILCLITSLKAYVEEDAIITERDSLGVPIRTVRTHYNWICYEIYKYRIQCTCRFFLILTNVLYMIYWSIFVLSITLPSFLFVVIPCYLFSKPEKYKNLNILWPNNNKLKKYCKDKRIDTNKNLF